MEKVPSFNGVFHNAIMGFVLCNNIHNLLKMIDKYTKSRKSIKLLLLWYLSTISYRKTMLE